MPVSRATAHSLLVRANSYLTWCRRHHHRDDTGMEDALEQLINETASCCNELNTDILARRLGEQNADEEQERRWSMLSRILDERIAQRMMYSLQADDEHTPERWTTLRAHYEDQARYANSVEEEFRAVCAIAALCLAQMESLERAYRND